MSSGKPQFPTGTVIAIGAVVLLVVALIAVQRGQRAAPPAPAPIAAAAVEQPAAMPADQAKALAERKAAGWEEIERGLLWRRVKGDGGGRHPLSTDTVKIHYEGKLTDGTTFDSSWDRGEPASFALGGLIEAWQLALPKAGVGDTIEIAVPPALGYGAEGKGPIPGGAVLLFKIELLGIE